MYVTSVAGMIYMLWYVAHNRHATIEAIERGDLSATRILFSMRGEPVSLYLRIAICSKFISRLMYNREIEREQKHSYFLMFLVVFKRS